MTSNGATANDFRDDLIRLIPHLRAFARSICNDATYADDLAQDALAKALASEKSFTMGTNMKAWVFMILRNQFYSNKRRSWRSQPLDPEVAERTLVSVSDPTASLELDELRRALAMLPHDMREALILIGAGGMSYEEVSEITGVAMGTVKSRVSRARDRLALIYAEGDIAGDDVKPSAAMAAIMVALDGHARAA
ncbi:sigma-70 family RNA polymerase sigma factor [Phenylobacterium sp.]|uniref:sigma-70 family RNA polymerase sigma factor n=1 Tax=Phenylobacterium sp. TaxID=1871053 RepID=UPI002732DA38|nr:sigma-70 family RNA polymerase sigma factor [Phenylobacterium sp.]MDP3855069.1 sigma-70 family RNA polymerase sigma factor [Phenylobacterium sp.]